MSVNSSKIRSTDHISRVRNKNISTDLREMSLIRPNHVTLPGLSAQDFGQFLLQFLHRILRPLFCLGEAEGGEGRGSSWLLKFTNKLQKISTFDLWIYFFSTIAIVRTAWMSFQVRIILNFCIIPFNHETPPVSKKLCHGWFLIFLTAMWLLKTSRLVPTCPFSMPQLVGWQGVAARQALYHRTPSVVP